jgi:cyclopropane fatty-acyl-phospholipid synthase-like methyltransferase
MNDSASKYYDILSPYYDKATEVENAWTPPRMVQRSCSKLLKDNIRVLDIGVGTGRSIDFIAKSNYQIEIHGVDISEKMLTICRSKYPASKLFHGDLKAYRTRGDVPFDLIISSGVLEFVKDLGTFFKDCATLLTDVGSCVFTYEPVVEFHKLQSEEQSLTVTDKNSKLYVDDFVTYRRRFLEIQTYLNEANLRVDEFSEFVAYNKGGIDIIYHLIRAVHMSNN